MSPEGNTWPASRRFAIGYAVAITALIINSIYTLHNLGIISNSWSAVAASQETLAGLDDVLLSVTEAETGQRGYLLDGDEQYLDPYTRSHPVVAAAIDRLRSLAGRDARRHEQVRALASAADAKLTELAQTIRLRKEGGFDAAIAVVRTDRGKQSMDTIRRLIAAMRSDEAASRGRLEARLHAAIRMTTLAFLFASAVALALLLGVHLLSERGRRALGRYVAWLTTTLRSIGDGVIATDAEGRVTFLNPVAESLTGWPRDEASGKPLVQVLRITNQHTGEPAEDPVAKVLRDGIVVGLANHTVLTARDGTARPIDDSAAPIKDDDGRIHGVVLVFHDVSVKHAAEDSLRDARRARRAAEAERRRAEDTGHLLAAIVEILRRCHHQQVASTASSRAGIRAAERIFGYAAAEVIGQPISRALMPPDHAEDVHRILHHIRRGERVEHFETRRVTKDGRLIDVSLTVSPIRDADGTIVGASKIARDITDRKQAEAERERLLAAAEAARAQAELANRIKDEFLAIALPRASHAAQRHPRLGQDPPLRQGRCRRPGAGPRRHRAEFPGPGPHHR